MTCTESGVVDKNSKNSNEVDADKEQYSRGDIFLFDEENKRYYINLDAANEFLASLTAEERLVWAVNAFGLEVVLLSSMQVTSSVLMHMFHELGLHDHEIVLIDTGRLFPETRETVKVSEKQYGLNLVTLYPEVTHAELEEKYGTGLYTDERTGQQCSDLYIKATTSALCCKLLKGDPFRKYLEGRGFSVVVKGLRRAEGGKRADTQPLIYDPENGVLILSLIFDWTDEMIRDYIDEHGVPVNPLYEQYYTSIGCEWPCTEPVEPEDGEVVSIGDRRGRFAHREKTECGEGSYCGLNPTDRGGKEKNAKLNSGWVEIPYRAVSSNSGVGLEDTSVTSGNGHNKNGRSGPNQDLPGIPWI